MNKKLIALIALLILFTGCTKEQTEETEAITVAQTEEVTEPETKEVQDKEQAEKVDKMKMAASEMEDFMGDFFAIEYVEEDDVITFTPIGNLAISISLLPLLDDHPEYKDTWNELTESIVTLSKGIYKNYDEIVGINILHPESGDILLSVVDGTVLLNRIKEVQDKEQADYVDKMKMAASEMEDNMGVFFAIEYVEEDDVITFTPLGNLAKSISLLPHLDDHPEYKDAWNVLTESIVTLSKGFYKNYDEIVVFEILHPESGDILLLVVDGTVYLNRINDVE